MVLLARERNPEIDFFEGDAQELDFDDDSFDCVVMNFGLLHLSRPAAALKPGECCEVWAAMVFLLCQAV